jgi:hypothetical protein
MSYDMAFWHEADAVNAVEAHRKYDAMTEGDSGVTTESVKVADFHNDVLRVYPELTLNNEHESPWTSPVYYNGECVLVAISWSRKDQVVESLIAMAQNRGVLAYDPQKEELYR